MRKLFLFVFSLIFTISAFTFAGEIGDIDLDFCQQGSGIDDAGWILIIKSNQLTLDVIPEKDYDVCMMLTNRWSQKMTFHLGFVDGTLTNDGMQNKACENENWDHDFQNFIKDYDSEITLNAGETVETHATLRVPMDKGWKLYGCATYYEVQSWEGSNDMLQVLVRKANFLDLFVHGDVTVWLWFVAYEDDLAYRYIGDSEFIKIYTDSVTDELRTEIVLINTWSVLLDAQITWTLYGLFWYEQIFLQENKKVLGGSDIAIRNLISWLPFYKGFLKVHYDVSYTPIIDFDWLEIDDEIKATHYLSEEVSLFLYSWFLIVLLLLFLLIIILLIVMKHIHKKHHHLKKELATHKKKSTSKVKTKKVITKKKPVAKKPIKKKK